MRFSNHESEAVFAMLSLSPISIVGSKLVRARLSVQPTVSRQSTPAPPSTFASRPSPLTDSSPSFHSQTDRTIRHPVRERVLDVSQIPHTTFLLRLYLSQFGKALCVLICPSRIRGHPPVARDLPVPIFFKAFLGYLGALSLGRRPSTFLRRVDNGHWSLFHPPGPMNCGVRHIA
jgi:hypothetical protein